MQIVEILRKILNSSLSSVHSVSILQFSEHIQLLFDNSNVNNATQIKQKKASFFSANFSELSKFSSLSFWQNPCWKSKLPPTNNNRSAFLSCFPVFSQTFLKLIFGYQNKNNVVETVSCFVLAAVKKILCILCVWTLKILYTNKRILT